MTLIYYHNHHVQICYKFEYNIVLSVFLTSLEGHVISSSIKQLWLLVEIIFHFTSKAKQFTSVLVLPKQPAYDFVCFPTKPVK